MNILWTNRDLDIVETLTRRVRILSFEQLKRIWWPHAGSRRVVRRRLRQLVTAGLIGRKIINVHPLLPITEPLARWSRETVTPKFDRVAKAAKARWTEPAVPSEVFFATKLAANLFASTSHGLPPLTQRNHDLLLGQVYVFYRTTRPEQATRWVGEDVMAKAGYRVKDPDAFLVDEAGRFERVIESVGAYSVKQIASFHRHCFEYELPYELW